MERICGGWQILSVYFVVDSGNRGLCKCHYEQNDDYKETYSYVTQNRLFWLYLVQTVGSCVRFYFMLRFIRILLKGEICQKNYFGITFLSGITLK